VMHATILHLHNASIDGSPVAIARLGTQNHGAMHALRELRDHDEHQAGNKNWISLWHIPPVDDAPCSSELWLPLGLAPHRKLGGQLWRLSGGMKRRTVSVRTQ
jgi:hypothetical protein